MKKIFIFTDGGLGNRLNSLVGGLITAEITNSSPVICWPTNNWCGCLFEDLYLSSLPVTQNNLHSVFLDDDRNYLIHENQSGRSLKNVFSHSTKALNHLRNADTDIVYYHNRIPDFYNAEKVLNYLKTLKIKESILSVAEDFCDSNAITRATKGVHIRKTDFGNQLDSTKIFHLVKRDRISRYFVCSDDESAEKEFSALENVITFPKKNYVEKLVDGGWTAKISDTEGRIFSYNVSRSRQSVIEAFADMLILSRTRIVLGNKSSFKWWEKTKIKSSFLSWATIYSRVENLRELC